MTARPLDAGSFEFGGGATFSDSGFMPSAHIGIGLGKKLDLGVQTEVTTFGAYLKYALFSRPTGPSVALLGGYGGSTNGNYTLGGAIFSIKNGAFEPYAAMRYNLVRVDTATLDSTIFGTSAIPIGSYNYASYSVGAVLWPLSWMGFSFEVELFGSGTPVQMPVLYAMGLVVR
jgi:hypothetical protein